MRCGVLGSGFARMLGHSTSEGSTQLPCKMIPSRMFISDAVSTKKCSKGRGGTCRATRAWGTSEIGGF